MLDVAELAKSVGADSVHADQATLDKYSSDMSFVNRMRPACVVKPLSARDVQTLVTIARESRTPLVPISSGPPHFRGDTVPGTGGAMVVDLSGMKRVVHVDREARSVLFEPGVTFGELIPVVTKAGLRLNMPLLPRQTKSVVGSLLEREPVTMPQYHWDIADPLNCVEIIFGTGDMFRTGAAAGPGAIEEQWSAGGAQVEAAGPSTASWYRIVQGAQGTMGIVTWASARCEILPRAEGPYLVGSAHLDRLVDVIHWLVRLRIVNECFILNRANLAAMMAGEGGDGYRKIRDSLPEWALFYNVAGYDYVPEERVRGQAADAADVTQRAGVEPARALGQVTAERLLRAVQNPAADPPWKIRRTGACHDIFFLTNHDRLPGAVEVMYRAAESSGYPTTDVGVYIQPLVQGSNIHCEFNLPYGPSSPNESERVRDLARRTVDPLMSRGAFFSRPYGEITAAVMNRDAATVAALRKVKSILDPDGIMNPGRLCF